MDTEDLNFIVHCSYNQNVATKKSNKKQLMRKFKTNFDFHSENSHYLVSVIRSNIHMNCLPLFAFRSVLFYRLLWSNYMYVLICSCKFALLVPTLLFYTNFVFANRVFCGNRPFLLPPKELQSLILFCTVIDFLSVNTIYKAR